MAKKTEDQAKAAAADAKAVDHQDAADKEAAPAASAPVEDKGDADQAKADGAAAVADQPAPASPAPATDLENPSGAIMEPQLERSVDLSHESVDANPRAGTTAAQNAVDWNDAKRAKPQDEDFAGQGLDQSVYGKGPKA